MPLRRDLRDRIQDKVYSLRVRKMSRTEIQRKVGFFILIAVLSGVECGDHYAKSDKLTPPIEDIVDDIDRAGEGTKACRYDEPPWSDCDPFELKRFRVLRLLHGGRQCEESKNITKHCTPGEFPPGTSWLIAEHRKCIAELTRLKAMIADLSKYIEALHGKGRTLFNAYLSLKKHLDELKQQIQVLQRDNEQQKITIANIREEIETWKSRAKDLQSELDELKTKYHDLQAEHKEGAEKLKECHTEKSRCSAENDRLKKKLHEVDTENSEIKRRLLEAQKYKEQLKEVKFGIAKLEYKVEKLRENLQVVKDKLADCKLELILAQHHDIMDNSKDTKVDMNMEMWIIHNKTKSQYPTEMLTTPRPEKTTTRKPIAVCMITYYGYTNETCWYDTKGQTSEYEYADSMGHHLVEAHWKYFTLEVNNQYECDRAAQLHYEFLLNRCSPKHYLPVMSIYRPSEQAKELSTHIYPKPNVPQPGYPYRCWITFLGPHGHCERHMDRYKLYNIDDGVDGFTGGSSSKTTCLERAQYWTDYCENPAVATYVPDYVSSNWKEEDIDHDAHGGKMFEYNENIHKKINPESINPHNIKRPSMELPVEYEDTPEYRKSLNLQGKEREELLNSLKKRISMTRKDSINDVKWHGGDPPPLGESAIGKAVPVPSKESSQSSHQSGYPSGQD